MKVIFLSVVEVEVKVIRIKGVKNLRGQSSSLQSWLAMEI